MSINVNSRVYLYVFGYWRLADKASCHVHISLPPTRPSKFLVANMSGCELVDYPA